MGTPEGMDAAAIDARYGPPPVRVPARLDAVPSVIGRRVLVAVIDPEFDLLQWAPGYIAASDVFEQAGASFVNVVEERQWWDWALDDSPGKPARCPRAKCWWTFLVRLSPEEVSRAPVDACTP